MGKKRAGGDELARALTALSPARKRAKKGLRRVVTLPLEPYPLDLTAHRRRTSL